MVKNMAFVAYWVRDLPAAKTFYRDTIGLTPSDMFGDHWAEFDVGGTTFGIGNDEPFGIPPGTSFSATFEVDDINRERQRLLALNVAVTDVRDMPVCLVAFVTDPEGNMFGIHQRKPQG